VCVRACHRHAAQEYQRLVSGLLDAGAVDASAGAELRRSPVLSDDELREVVPGSVRKVCVCVYVLLVSACVWEKVEKRDRERARARARARTSRSAVLSDDEHR